ncbi:cell division protein FtsQ/DivIB [Qipengyuania sp. JC766]|uniref:cell division protein FtsQ/DivIB n=1 Tax=Qipengyuania sp. JC766 TaxID=3232139 RepID=UPI0034584CE1
MARVKRKPTSARRSTAQRKRATTARRAKAKTMGLTDQLVAILPFTEEQLQKAFLVVILAVAGGLAWLVASLAGVPAMAQAQMAVWASDSGFEVQRVQVTGVDRINELRVYERVLSARETPMPLVDLEAIRSEVVELSWVKDARVSRQLPDTILVDIVEREPHAVLRKPDRLVLIDETGEELEPISAENAKGMLIVSGMGARKQVVALGELLDAAPALKPQVVEAEWIGNRRWNLTFKTDQVLAMPEGSDEAASALVSFAKLDGRQRLLGGRVARFDMRAPGRVYMLTRDGDRIGEGEGS